MREFAGRLISYGTKADKASATKLQAVFPVIESLRPQLANLLGNAGFRALLARSLALANEEVPWLRALHVNSDGFVDGWDEHTAKVGADETFEARVVLLAQLLGLMVAFIGEGLTLQLVRDVWPKLSANDFYLDMEIDDGTK